MATKYRWLAGLKVLKAGEAYLATRKGDYECQSRSFASTLYRSAKKRDNVSVSVSVFQDCVVYTFWRTDNILRPNLKRYPIVLKMRGENGH